MCPHGDTEGPRAQAAPLERAEGPGEGPAALPAAALPAARRAAPPGREQGCRSGLVRMAFHLASALTAPALDKWRGPVQVKSILTFASGVTGL